MRATSSDRRQTRPPRPARGFTMVELIAVLLLVSLLAAVVLPRLEGALSMRNTAWHDQVLAALRQARHLAQGHRRLVCVSVATGSVTLSIAAVNPASACTASVPGPDGQAAWATDAAATATTATPTGTMYFQPDGRITSDGAGATPVDVTIAISGETAITLVGDTGHVR